MTLRAHTRQRDTCMFFDWLDDPPQEVRALLQNLLHKCLPLIVLLLHLAVALSQLRACPHVEPVTFHQVRPVARFPRHNRLTHPSAIPAPSITTRNSSNSSMCGDSSCQLLLVSSCAAFISLFQKFVCPQLCDRKSCPHFFTIKQGRKYRRKKNFKKKKKQYDRRQTLKLVTSKLCDSESISIQKCCSEMRHVEMLSSEALPVGDGRARSIVLALRDPHLQECAEGRQN